jgi:flavin reductase (DIM6/NTAB) family NADH-FMN oxidoreductase RutF
MRYDLADLPERLTYKLLAATAVPRPIAWVVTQDRKGGRNAAPYSFFNVMGAAPPTVALGIMADPRGLKDTAQNIADTGEFVINLVPEAMVQAMNVTAVDAPRGVDELALAALATLPSVHVVPPRIAQSPVAYECRLVQMVHTGPDQVIVIGRVLAVHIDDRVLIDPERAHIDTPSLDLVARGFGSTYIRSQDSFELARPVWADLTKGV